MTAGDVSGRIMIMIGYIDTYEGAPIERNREQIDK